MVLFRDNYLVIFQILALVHLFVSPYTKVEESFIVQAIHDVLEHGFPTHNAGPKLKILFDHMTFSGSVPRTFIGSLIVSVIAQPLTWLFSMTGPQKQVLARAILGFINAEALSTYNRAVRKTYGDRTALWYLAFQASQFHLFYYASRTLPNMFAFALSTFALAAALPNPTSTMGQARKRRLSFYLLTMATVVFRSELVLLLAAQAMHFLIRSENMANRASFIRRIVIPPALSAAVVGILLTVLIDSHMWQTNDYIWPEANAFLFNVFPKDGQTGASAWGTSPWYWYFTSAIPRLLLNPCVLLLEYGLFHTTQRSAILDQLIPSLTYTALYSFLPHKETRFLFPIVPQLTLSLALTASYLSTRRQLVSKFLTQLLILSTITVAIVSHGILLPLSAQTYPGAHALQKLHAIHALAEAADPVTWSRVPQIDVYLTNLALQTGITRFNEQPTKTLNITKYVEVARPESPPPLILPGSPDGRFPALTISPKSTGTPSPHDALYIPPKKIKGSHWVYDKTTPECSTGDDTNTSTNTNELGGSRIPSRACNQRPDPAFWTRFDYVIVEDPTHIPSNAFEQVGVAYSLQRTRPRLVNIHKNPDTLTAQHLFFRDPQDADTANENGSQSQQPESHDAISLLLNHMYTPTALTSTSTSTSNASSSYISLLNGITQRFSIASLYGIVHDVVLLGYGAGGQSLTRGWWIEWGLEERLYIMRRRSAVDDEIVSGVEEGVRW